METAVARDAAAHADAARAELETRVRTLQGELSAERDVAQATVKQLAAVKMVSLVFTCCCGRNGQKIQTLKNSVVQAICEVSV